MTNITKRAARICNRIQLPTAFIWSLSVVVLIIAAVGGWKSLGLVAALTCMVSMVALLAAILTEMCLVYRMFDRANGTWTTAWGHRFIEDHMPGKVAHE